MSKLKKPGIIVAVLLALVWPVTKLIKTIRKKSSKTLAG
jgi:hypothetical protein